MSFVFQYLGVLVFQNSVNYLKKNSYLFLTICVLYFNDYDIHVNALFKEANVGFKVQVKNIYI